MEAHMAANYRLQRGSPRPMLDCPRNCNGFHEQPATYVSFIAC